MAIHVQSGSKKGFENKQKSRVSLLPGVDFVYALRTVCRMFGQGAYITGEEMAGRAGRRCSDLGVWERGCY